MAYRINGFEQIKGFYSWVFNNPDKVRPTHISLYLFLVNQNNRSNWSEWFKCPYDLAMAGACIGNNGTYYRCLDDLKKWGLLDYKQGVNKFKAPIISLSVLCDNEQVTVPLSEQVTVLLSEQVTEQLSAQLCEQLPVHIYKLITDNIETINNKQDEFYSHTLLFFSEPEKQIKFNFAKSFIELGADENIVSDYIKVRKAKKATNTKTAFDSIIREIKKTNLTINECLKLAVEKSWSGFNADWDVVKTHKPSKIKKSDEFDFKDYNIPNDCTFGASNNEELKMWCENLMHGITKKHNAL